MTMMTPMGRGGRMYSRPRRWPRVVAIVVVLALVGAAGAAAWWWLNRDDDVAAPQAAASTSCRTPAPHSPQSLPPPAKVAVDVANGTQRSGLAIETADDLTMRGFRIEGIGNTEREVRAGVATVRYAKSSYGAAITVASYIPGATLVPVPQLKGDAVQLWLGPDFDGVVAARQADVSNVELPASQPICSSNDRGDRDKS